ncbi:hypothetical protein G195_003237 [Phytophthora kernoviae 00238/432]|uniref:Peptidase S1 domain-containing protein n=2 Tax=Phytophthora kernoviae TaxID=325452 RepID=A0A8T0M4J6_9STRA|nr:hypothetical protein G195_003237 [Phytophthora kernoviae 00238/432]KAG2528897.1 hypothetical protein JM16_000946 [Phytophthora kernoviae]
MKFATIVRAGVLVSALAATLTKGYTFSSDDLTDSAAEQSTGLTVNEEDRIYGGSEADASELPFIVSLRKDEAGGDTYCGGALIASQYVVTAAHCVKTDGSTIYASIGSAYESGTDDGEQIKVVQGYTHPLYNKSAHLYDVGLLKLETKASVSTLELCTADGSDNEVGTVATVRGWGLTENGSQSVVMEEANVEIISNSACNKEYDDRITEGMMCAGDGNGKDSCNGDSGGPLIANDVLVGIVSWGGKCGVNAGVYTRVSHVLDYINDIVSGGTGSSFTESVSGSSDEDQSSSTSTESPITETPTTEAPTSAPTTETPATKAPVTEAPTTEAPTPAPTAESPETDVLAFVSTLALSVNAYSFSESQATTAPPNPSSDTKESTGLSVNEESRIYGGSQASIVDYPYTVSLRIDGLDETFCGGTLIAPQYILTAGHCIKTSEYDINAIIGSEYGSGSKGEIIEVTQGFQHPMYNQKKHLYDVGLLKLKTPSTATTAKLCAKDGSDNKVGTVATVLGWGLTENGSESKTLQEVNVEIITNAECNKQYNNRITEGMMCAGNGNGKDSCNGDSGGPLISKNILVGFVSWGGKCGIHAGVYSRITYVWDYIQDILKGGDGSKFTGNSSTSSAVEAPANEASSTGKTLITSTAASTSTDGSTTTSSSSGSPTTSGSSSGLSPSSGSSTEQSTPSSTPTPAIETEAPATTAPTTSGGKGCSVRRARRRRLSSINEEEVEEDMEAAEKAKAVAQQKEAEAEADIKEAKETGDEEELEDAQAAKGAAEKEEEEAEEEEEEDEEEEEEDEEEEVKKMKDTEDGTEEEEEEEDEQKTTNSDKEGKEEAEEDEEDKEEENEEEEEEAENGEESEGEEEEEEEESKK